MKKIRLPISKNRTSCDRAEIAVQAVSIAAERPANEKPAVVFNKKALLPSPSILLALLNTVFDPAIDEPCKETGRHTRRIQIISSREVIPDE